MDRRMESLVVECLACRASRVASRDVFKRFAEPECPRCGYLGWAPALELTEADRDELRRHPLHERALRRVA
jgi:hypothetical protein